METPHTNPESNEHILDDVDYTLYMASQGKRFGNYLIDSVVFYITFHFVLFKPLVAVLTAIRAYTESNTALYVVDYLLIITWSVTLKAAFEFFTGGKTIAKFITRTRAVSEDGSRITAKTAILRSLSQLVPFEAFSALANPCRPWHDRWTKTYVIDENDSTLQW